MVIADSSFEELTQSSSVSLFPLQRSKVIHVVRHGQGHHNVAGELDPKSLFSWEFHDASLTDLGWRQVQSLREHVKKTHIYANVELVVVSPLLRTLQTAVGVFGGEDSVETEAVHDCTLMVDGVGKPPHASVSSVGAPPFLANEWCREHTGLYPCDKRSDISFLKTKFPGVDFSEVGTDEDTWWIPTVKETQEDLQTRGSIFVRWLLDRPESRIAVVSHGGFITSMLRLFGDDCSAVVKKEIHQKFLNCQMLSFTITDRGATSPPKSVNTNFGGGLLFNEQAHRDKLGESIPSTQILLEDKAVPQAHELPTIKF